MGYLLLELIERCRIYLINTPDDRQYKVVHHDLKLYLITLAFYSQSSVMRPSTVFGNTPERAGLWTVTSTMLAIAI